MSCRTLLAISTDFIDQPSAEDLLINTVRISPRVYWFRLTFVCTILRRKAHAKS